MARLLWTGTGLLWLGVLILRVGYPFHLEWLESHVFCQALRFAEGFPLYEDPAIGLPAHPYGPLYYLICGGLLKITGPSLLPARAISQCATLFIAFAVWKLARKNGASNRQAWIAPLAWFAFFPACGAWYDLARVDMLGLALWTGGLLLATDARISSRRWWSAIFVFALAGAAKQSCLPLAVCAWFCVSRQRDLKSQSIGAIATTVLTIGMYLGLDLLLDGRLLYYAWFLPASHPQSWEHAALLFVAPALPLALVGVAATFLMGSGGIARRHVALWFTSAAFCTWTVTKQGAFLNHYLPLAVLGAMLVPLAFEALAPTRAALWNRAVAAITLLFAVGFILVSSMPQKHVPTKLDRKAGEAWLTWLRACEVEVRMPGFTYLPVLAGMPIRVHEMAAIEVFDDWARRLAQQSSPAEAAARMAEQPDLRFLFTGEPTVFVLAGDRADTRGSSFFGPLIELSNSARQVAQWTYPDSKTFMALTGSQVRPTSIFVVPVNAEIKLPPLPR